MKNCNESNFEYFIDYINSLPQSTVKIINMDNYLKMLQVLKSLQNLLQKTSSEWKITFEINDKFNLGCIYLELFELSVLSPHDFAKIIDRCDNFEIYPLNNGTIRIDSAFQNVLCSIV